LNVPARAVPGGQRHSVQARVAQSARARGGAARLDGQRLSRRRAESQGAARAL